MSRTRLFTSVTLVLLCTQARSADIGASQPMDGTTLQELEATANLDAIREQRSAYEADKLVARAVREESLGRDVEAEALYARAVELDPASERAREGLQSTRERLGLITDPSPLIERAEKSLTVRRQELLYRFDAALSQAAQHVERGRPENFQSARLLLDRARLLREENPGVFSKLERGELDARITQHELALQRAIQRRDDVLREAQERDWDKRIKAARDAIRRSKLDL